MELSQYDAGSTAPYHIINTALNLQGSKDMTIRDRKSDFFVFTKKYIGENVQDIAPAWKWKKYSPSSTWERRWLFLPVRLHPIWDEPPIQG